MDEGRSSRPLELDASKDANSILLDAKQSTPGSPSHYEDTTRTRRGRRSSGCSYDDDEEPCTGHADLEVLLIVLNTDRRQILEHVEQCAH